MSYHKKLIEVALPLEAINREAAREKSIRHGHPSTLHLWWARRPLAACRAVLFASLVDDPSAHPDKFPTEETQEKERQRLFRIIEELVKWENSNNERVLKATRAEIMRSCNGNPPPVYDPFCGGGSIPLEAQRLGLEAHASDLNPVPVLITKALIEIPPRFAGKPPVNPESRRKLGASGSWKGAAGLAEDVRYYGQWMRDEAEKRIGHLYPKVKLPKEHGGGEATVIAWLWARTVASPNPVAKGAHVPLVRSFWVSTKAGKKAWVEPVVDKSNMAYRFEVRTGTGEPRAGTVSKKGNVCLLTDAPMTRDYIRSEAKAGRMSARLMAIVADGPKGRVFLPPDEHHEGTALKIQAPSDVPDTDIVGDTRYLTPTTYGMTKHRHLFTNRQLLLLTTLCSLVGEVRKQSLHDSVGEQAYADAVATYVAFLIDQIANHSSSICGWNSPNTQMRSVFSRQALSMVWDYAEVNVFSESSGSYHNLLERMVKGFSGLAAIGIGHVKQADASVVFQDYSNLLISTDPPYYDNVPYADLSDFFYIWLRRCLQSVYPYLLGTVLVPKAEELVSDPFRHGGKDKARKFFERGMSHVFDRMRDASDPRFPATIYYAFKQTEDEEEDIDEENEEGQSARASTGWETFLQGLADNGWQIQGTWPMRTEKVGRTREVASNALASSIVLVCRPRPKDAGVASRRDFLSALKKELPEALRHLQKGNIAPVDLAQAAIGPGMAVFSRYSKVLEVDGSTMTVRSSLSLINQILDEVLSEQEGEFDADTRWAIAWFEQNGFNEGPYGLAETLSTAKNTSVSGMVDAGFLASKGGKVRLLRPEELSPNWNPLTDLRLAVWEITHHLVRLYHAEKAGDTATAQLVAKLGSRGEIARDLAYRLFSICERRKWSQDALGYNALVVGWSDLTHLAQETRSTTSAQGELAI